MAAGAQMQSILYNDSAVRAAVDSWTLTPDTFYMIYDRIILPDFQNDDNGQVELDVNKKTVNHFSVGNEGGGHPVIDLTRQVSCRAYTQNDAETNQDACFNALNRVKSSDGKAFFVASKLPVIPPADKTDNYNAPLNVRTVTVRE